MQNTNKEKRVYIEIDRFYFLIALAAAFVLSLIYFGIAGWNAQSLQNFFQAVIVNVLTIFIAFAVGYAFLRRIQEIRAETERAQLIDEIATKLSSSWPSPGYPAFTCYEVFDCISWQKLFSGSHRVDILVHYFDTWVNNNFNLLQGFFNRGGTVRLIIPNYENASLVRVIKERFPEFTEDQVKIKIKQTPDRFNACLQRSRHRDARLEAYHINEMIWYCGMRFDDRVLILTTYEHMRELRVANPGFVIDLGEYPRIQEWFDREFSGLVAKHVNP